MASKESRFWCIVPTSVQEFYPKLKVLKVLQKGVQVKLVTYPGSPVVSHMKDLRLN